MRRVLANSLIAFVVLCSGCALHFHYHGTAAPTTTIEVQDSDNADDADARLRELLGVGHD
jgi:hypothetical protein